MTHDNIERHLTAVMDRMLATSRIVNLVGPRQVGKTTLVRDMYGRGDYYTLEDEDTLGPLEDDPRGQLSALAKKAKDGTVVLDEVQLSKKLSLGIKRIVDMDRRKGQFILTGSSNIFAFLDVADSLAGRMITIKLWPLTAAEIHGKQPNRLLEWASDEKPDPSLVNLPGKVGREDYIRLVLDGGFPEALGLPRLDRQDLYLGYVDAIVDRDAAGLFRVRKPDSMRRLIDQMAARTGQPLNAADLSRKIKISRSTLNDYLDALERLSLILKLGAWAPGETVREVKRPKYHFVDTGMCCALRGFDSESFDAGSGDAMRFGGLMESWVLNELTRALPHLGKRFRLYHWRSHDRREIDIIAEGGDRVIGIEVKASTTAKVDDFRHLKWFAKDGPGRNMRFTGIVLYLGEHAASFGDNCFLLPVSSLWADIDRRPAQDRP